MARTVNPAPATTPDGVLEQTANGIAAERLCTNNYAWETPCGMNFCLIGWLAYAAGVPVAEKGTSLIRPFHWSEVVQSSEGGQRDETRKAFPAFDEALTVLDAEALWEIEQRFPAAGLRRHHGGFRDGWDSPAEGLLEELGVDDETLQRVISRARSRLAVRRERVAA